MNDFTEEELEEMQQGGIPRVQTAGADPRMERVQPVNDRFEDLYSMVYDIFQRMGKMDEIEKRINRIEFKVTYVYKKEGGETAQPAEVSQKTFVPRKPVSPVVTVGGSTSLFR